MRSLILIAIAPLLITTLCIAQEVIFFDDFENGMDPAWYNPDGGWVVQDGKCYVTTSCGFYWCNPNLSAGGDWAASYIVTFDFLVTEAFSPSGAAVSCNIFLNDQLEPHEGEVYGYAIGAGYSANGSPENAIAAIQRLDGWDYPYLAQDFGEQYWIEPNVVYHMKLGRVGSEIMLKMWAEGESEPGWQLSAVDETYSSGYWMPVFWNNVGWIDNFKVEGYDVVGTEQHSWGSVKALFR